VGVGSGGWWGFGVGWVFGLGGVGGGVGWGWNNPPKKNHPTPTPPKHPPRTRSVDTTKVTAGDGVG